MTKANSHPLSALSTNRLNLEIESKRKALHQLLLAVTMLATMVSAADFSLRADASKFLAAEPAASAPTETRVIVQGLLHAASEDDLKIIGKSAVAAYNQAYGPYGHSIKAFKSTTSVSVSETPGTGGPTCTLCGNDDANITESKGQAEIIFGQVSETAGTGDPTCSLCGNDDTTFVELKGAQLGDVHKSFEEKFCAKLRSSGSANLANAQGCSFAIVDMPGQADFVPIESAYASTNGQSTEGQIVLRGTLNELSEADLKLLDKSVIAAYNDAFAKAGYKLKLKSKASVYVSETPGTGDPTCSLCGNDDMTFGEVQVVFSHVQETPGTGDPTCTFCGNDDEVVLLKDSEVAYMHKAFEKAFCAKLQNSGVANFANVHGCSFRFVYNPV